MNKDQIQSIRKEIEDLKIQRTEQERIREEADERIWELDSQINDKEESLRVYDYYAAIRSFFSTLVNGESHYLFRDTATRDLMTNLKRRRYTLKEHEWVDGKYTLVEKGQRIVDYYIINHRYILIYSGRLNLHFRPQIYASYTATEFKKNGYISKPPFDNDDDDMVVELPSGKKMRIYDSPVMLCGQTYDDMDYRKEWVNGELEYEGNNYGDTSDFYFVGELI